MKNIWAHLNELKGSISTIIQPDLLIDSTMLMQIWFPMGDLQ